MQAIKQKCIECSGGSTAEVKLCNIEKCALYPYRLGKDPNISSRQLSEEQRALFKERMHKYWEDKKREE